MVCGQRLGAGHVQRGGDPARRKLDQQCLGVDQLAAGHVDQQRAVREQAEVPRAEQPLGLRRVRGRNEDDVGRGQQRGQVTERVDRRRPGPAATGHPGDRGNLEGVQAGLDGRADVPVAHDQHPLISQGPAGALIPGARELVPGEQVQAPAAGQGQGYRQLGGTGVVQPRRVAQRHPVRQQRDHVLVAGRERLDHFEPRHLGHLVQDSGALHVGQDVESDFADGCGQFVAVGPVVAEFQPAGYRPQPPFGFSAADVGHPGEWHESFSFGQRVHRTGRGAGGRAAPSPAAGKAGLAHRV
jgi:hypothetical protein